MTRKKCEHKDYEILDIRRYCITAICNECGARLYFILKKIEEAED